MPPRSISGLVHVGLDILATTISQTTSKIVAQIGDAITQRVDSSAVEWWQHVGFASRPAKPSAGRAAAQCVALKTSDRDVAVASQDTRGLEIYGNLGHGEFCVYAAGEDGESQGRLIGKTDGSVTILTTDTNTADGETVALKLSPTALRFTAPWGDFVFDASGCHVKTRAGPRIDLGGVSVPGLAPQALADALTGYARITAPIVKLDAAGVYLGGGKAHMPATYTPVVAPQPVAAEAAFMSALLAFANAVGPAFTSLAGAAVPATAASSMALAASALATAAAACPTPIHSQTVWSAP
jgi:hypothetical protein